MAESEIKPDPVSPKDLVLSVSTVNILDFLDKMTALGVVKIFFNANKDSHGFHHDLKMMRPIYEHLKGKNLLSKTISNTIETPLATLPEATPGAADFDALSVKANAPNAPMDDLNALFGAAFGLGEWLFIARGEMPNVNPYIASNAEVAGGQQMIRAFTDSQRLQRFAEENDLTDADGGTQILSIPTEGIVEYLEQFMPYGVHGIWFNSDSKSDGFFIPLKQLRPVKEHLAKLKPPAAKTEWATLLVIVSDGLMQPSGAIAKSPYNCNFFCRAPKDWTADGELKPEYLEKLYEQFYGANWRAGNSDGSRYVIIEANTMVLHLERVERAKWNVPQNTELNRYWHYIGDANGGFKSVTGDEFQADVDASLQTVTDEARNRQDNLADLGVSETADGGFDLNLTVNQVGAIGFETSIAPFHEAVAPLLKDYQGTGEYVTLLRFDEGGKSDQVESIIENAHGAYLQIRRFVYLNPKNNTRIGVNSIHSRRLRHVKTNAELLVSFELCKNLDNQTAAFYYAFQGPKADVLNLAAAIQPALDSCGYQAVL
jgi:hypothetical protein